MMAVAEERMSSAPHGIRWFSTQSNKNLARKQKVKTGKKLSNLEALYKLGDGKREAKSTQALQCFRLTVHSPVEKPPRIRRKTSNTSSLDSKLSKKKSENLDYAFVFVEETEIEKSMRERLISEVKQQNWVESDNKAQHDLSRLSSPRFSLRKGNATTQGFYKSKSSSCFIPRSRYCNRLVHMDKDEFSRQFCDVLGPTLCADCTRTQMQQFVIDEHTRNFPDICVSPYVLCVPQETERDLKTPFTVYRDCDPLQRKRPSTVIFTHSTAGLKTRPNSQCSDEKMRLTHDRVLNTSSPTETPVHETPLSSPLCSRRSSISRYLTESKNEQSLSLSSRRVKISTAFRSGTAENKNQEKFSSDRLEPNCFSKRKSGACSTTRRAVSKTRSISRTGKLSELPYWKFLIPEPPMMEVGRMNVSIYTPKQLPGIKIFDEALFDI